MKGILITALATFLVVTTTPVFAEKSKSMNSNSYTIDLGDGILLQMTVAPFDAKKHKIKKCQILDWSGVCLIDGKPVFGTDWGLPRNQLVQAELKIGAKTINLDVSCMYNVTPTPQDFTLEKVEGGYLIRGHFSDGAGSYEAEWFVIENTSVRTRLANKEC
jgi:hypothetical protein